MQHLGDPDGREELLVLRALKLGDLLVSVPGIKALRRAFPEHRLILAMPGWLEPIIDLVPGVDALLPTPGLDHPLPLPAGRIDTAVNFHGNGPESRGALELLQARRRIGHASPGWDGPEWRDDINERERWARLVREHGYEADAADVAIDVPETPSVRPGAAVLHVGAFYGSREWPVERFGAVARAMIEEGREVVFSGSGKERPRAIAAAEAAGAPESAVLAGELDLSGFAALIADASVVVSADTGAAHLATAYRRPSVVIFGPAEPRHWGPPADGPHVVLTDESLRVGDTFGSEPDPALLAVTVDDVLEAVDGLAARRD